MSMELKQTLKMSQQLRMTPQLQQAIKLLQLSRMELATLVSQEMVENPALEEVADSIDASESKALSSDNVDPVAERAAEAAADAAAEVVPEMSAADAVKEPTPEQWEQYLENSSGPLPSNSFKGMNDDLPSIEATLTREDDLYQNLRWQLGLTHLTDEERAVLELIIGNLDEHGYFVGSTLEEIAEEAGCSAEFVEECLEILQEEFEPVGVGGRDLKECLLIQARQLYKDEDPIFEVISEHIPNLEKKRYDSIARALGISMDDVIQAAKKVSKLNPRPGREFACDPPQYITPDIYVHKIGDEYIAVINDDGIPKLKVSSFYRDALAQGQMDGAKKYIQEKVRNAAWLIQSIYRRQRTIIKVTNSIIKFQRDFLDHGITQLRPLVLRDVADDIGMHESTISRVTTNKYVHTAQGIYELKFFFNSSINKVYGADIASEAVKDRIKAVIDDENPKKPYSDSKLVNILREQHNIDIARRTVAKYREMLGILSSTKRKRLF
jgi:RNA polymerase sigma-54 factor